MGLPSLDKRPRLAIIPTGTTNDYARALKFQWVILLGLLRLLLKNETIHMDIGRAFWRQIFY